MSTVKSVSYTHLDVYKRQDRMKICEWRFSLCNNYSYPEESFRQLGPNKILYESDRILYKFPINQRIPIGFRVVE